MHMSTCAYDWGREKGTGRGKKESQAGSIPSGEPEQGLISQELRSQGFWDNDLRLNQESGVEPLMCPKTLIFHKCLSYARQRTMVALIKEERKKEEKRVFLLFFKILFIYSWETQRGVGQRYRQREKQAPCREPNVGSRPRPKAALNSWATWAAQSFCF